MKVVILAGGLGTRLSEETEVKPKPMVAIGGRPILWHIMKIYSSYGFNEFVVCLGYKGYIIKEFFANYFLHRSDLTIDLTSNKFEIHSNNTEPWKITLVDTGDKTMTGGRILRVREYLGSEPFMVTYGDGVADIDIEELLKFHRGHAKYATVTAVRPPSRFGGMAIEETMVTDFIEKPQIGEGWINGGFFVFEPEVLNYIKGDETLLEREPLETLARDGQLAAYRHNRFWQCMDTLRDVHLLNELWDGWISAVEAMAAMTSIATALRDTYRNRRVLITGHTGFKGSWLALWLKELEAQVAGFALDPQTERDNFVACRVEKEILDFRGDVRDYKALSKALDEFQPEFVFHLAAQAIVREAYVNPKETFDTNIGGTVNVLECCRLSDSAKVIVNITSDKCYENREWAWGYRECDPMGGYDPYSASKGCSELVSAAYQKSFFNGQSSTPSRKILSTVRAGNVIGGGDWAKDRIVPDCIRALEAGIPIQVRNPAAIRPWQHVLEPLGAYLLLGAMMYQHGHAYGGPWNFGPERISTVRVSELVGLLVEAWGSGSWESPSMDPQVHEANLLTLDINKARYQLGWSPCLNIPQAVQKTVEWYKCNSEGSDVRTLVRQQIWDYMGEMRIDDRSRRTD